MTAPIVLVLPYPVSANRYWRDRTIKSKATGKYITMRYHSEEAKEYIAACQAVALAAGINEPLLGRLEVGLRLYPHRPQDWQKRQRDHGELWDDDVRCIDLGNCEKVTSDALQGIVFPDDKSIRKMVLERMEPDEHPARLVVYLRPIPLKATQQALL
jgi:crossover junction endodeoxyribonuclease RusA